ncbi:hypothetical protein AB6N30_08285 [Fusobacterium animalis]|uniref:hypothetical protein n=1 Tax=Fusobacterium TaxID=848 RepID=UPI0003B7ECEC|nr:hypothetical protein [Fusobacterium nucleatum]ERT32867.1 hypothetical protein HMPREF1766_01959 [Fusobacterium nucleatum CTI-5]
MKILYVGYKFYGYENEIIEKLKKENEVIFLDYTPSFLKMVVLKVIRIIFGNALWERYLSHEVKKSLRKEIIKKSEKEDIDILFVIAWSFLKRENLVYLENFYKFKKKKLYLWDDIGKIKNFFEYKDYFDEVYSFDRRDCKNFNLKYRPTFYSERLKFLKKENEIKYIFSFIGEYSLRRSNLLKKIVQDYKKSFIYLYYSPYIYLLKYLFNKEYKIKDIKFSKISRENYNNILQESEIIIDLINSEQTGVTQRSLDAIFLEKKIITNNANIKLSPIYLENNVLVINEDQTKEKIISKVNTFLSTEYIKYPKEVIKYYSLDKWVEELFYK